MGTTDNFCLHWNDFESNLSAAFKDLRDEADFFDVTLATDEGEVQAHRVVLSACSPHLKSLLKRQAAMHPTGAPNLIIYLRGVRHVDLVSLIEFMYMGQVSVGQEDLNCFLSVAEDLRVRGLTQNLAKEAGEGGAGASGVNTSSTKRQQQATPGTSSSAKRQREERTVKREPETDQATGNDNGVGAKQSMVVTPDFSFSEPNVEGQGDGYEDGGEGYEFGASGGYTQEVGTYSHAENKVSDNEKEQITDDVELGDDGGTASNDNLSVASLNDDAERDLLSSEITSFLISMSVKKTDESGRYQCLICARENRDLYNQRQHVLTHMFKDIAFSDRLNNFVRRHVIEQSKQRFACLKCRTIFNREFYYMRNHFVIKHLKSTEYGDMP